MMEAIRRRSRGGATGILLKYAQQIAEHAAEMALSEAEVQVCS